MAAPAVSDPALDAKMDDLSIESKAVRLTPVSGCDILKYPTKNDC